MTLPVADDGLATDDDARLDAAVDEGRDATADVGLEGADGDDIFSPDTGLVATEAAGCLENAADMGLVTPEAAASFLVVSSRRGRPVLLDDVCKASPPARATLLGNCWLGLSSGASKIR